MTMTITIETMDDTIITAKLITWMEANKIARNSGVGLTYLMNVMDINSKKNTVYAWFKDNISNESYLIELQTIQTNP